MKGMINENITEMLNLRPLDEVLKEKGVEIDQPPAEPMPDEVQEAVSTLRDMSAKLAMVEGTDHSDAMDDLHSEIIQHARDLMAYGFNIDHPRARGIFEIAASLYGHAITTKNSKRDAQLKAMKLSLDKKRVELEEQRTHHALGMADTQVGDDGTILVEDRNELLRRLKLSRS